MTWQMCRLSLFSEEASQASFLLQHLMRVLMSTGRKKTDLMAGRLQRLRPVMVCSTGFHPDQARPKAFEKLHHSRTAELTAHNGAAGKRDAMKLKDMLCKAKAGNTKLFHGESLLKWWLITTISTQCDAE